MPERHIRIRAVHPVNQDAVIIFVHMYMDDCSFYLESEGRWVQYHGMDLITPFCTITGIDADVQNLLFNHANFSKDTERTEPIEKFLQMLVDSGQWTPTTD